MRVHLNKTKIGRTYEDFEYPYVSIFVCIQWLHLNGQRHPIQMYLKNNTLLIVVKPNILRILTNETWTSLHTKIWETT